MSEEAIRIIRRSDDALVEAKLFGELKPEDLVLIERSWTTERQKIMRKLLAIQVPRNQWPQSLHWDWGRKSSDLKLLGTYGWGIEREGCWEAVLLVERSSHFADLDGDRGKPLVYIDYFETAPWNWNYDELEQHGQYRGLGQILFQTAVQHSNDEGFHGRVGLHALPQAENFYEQACGMTRFAKDPDKQGLVYFELSRAAAARRLMMEEGQ